jgi:nucleotide-binding universal stress UspA family protein
MPVLAGAETVTVLVIPDGDDVFAGDDLKRHFGLHHCAFRLVIERRRDLTTAEIIRHHVKQAGADLLVAGLYGRPRVQEIVLGGVSRDLLRAPPVPLFVSH